MADHTLPAVPTCHGGARVPCAGLEDGIVLAVVPAGQQPGAAHQPAGDVAHHGA